MRVIELSLAARPPSPATKQPRDGVVLYPPRRQFAAPSARARRAVEVKEMMEAIEAMETSEADPAGRSRRDLAGRMESTEARHERERSELRAVLGMGCLMRLAFSHNDGASRDRGSDSHADAAAGRPADDLSLAIAALSLIAGPAVIVDPRGETLGANQAFLSKRGLFKPMIAALAAPDAARPPTAGRKAGLRYDPATGGVANIFVLRDPIGAERGKLILLRAPAPIERCCDPELLAQAFALTPAEAKLACALMRTKSLSAAIGELGLKEKTGRTYLDRVFQKTGAKSQLQLYAILMELYLLSRVDA